MPPVALGRLTPLRRLRPSRRPIAALTCPYRIHALLPHQSLGTERRALSTTYGRPGRTTVPPPGLGIRPGLGHSQLGARNSSSSRRIPRPHWTQVGPGLVCGTGLSTSKQTLLLRCTIVDRYGHSRVVSGDFYKAALCAEHGLEVRDLRKIDSRVPNVVPTILARRGAFLVNMLHIRALVKHDTVLLFDG